MRRSAGANRGLILSLCSTRVARQAPGSRMGASRGRQHLRHRLDPLGDQRRWSGDLELWVHRTHAQRQERYLHHHHLVPLCLGQFRAIDPVRRPVRVSTSPTFSSPTNTGSYAAQSELRPGRSWLRRCRSPLEIIDIALRLTITHFDPDPACLLLTGSTVDRFLTGGLQGDERCVCCDGRFQHRRLHWS